MPGSAGPRVVTVNELPDGQIVLDIECLDRTYLSGFVKLADPGGLAQNGITEPRHLDLWTALITGLVDQQVANDPGGNRRTSRSPLNIKGARTTMTTVDATTIAPLTHRDAMRRQALELDRTLGLLRSLDDASWAAPTDCPAWDVRAMYQHVLGACEAGASIRENIRQLRAARAYRNQHGGPLEAALSAVQVRERAGLTPAQVMNRLTAVAPRTVRGRGRTPALLRNHTRLAVDGPVHETWTLGYLIDTIYLRDL